MSILLSSASDSSRRQPQAIELSSPPLRSTTTAPSTAVTSLRVVPSSANAVPPCFPPPPLFSRPSSSKPSTSNANGTMAIADSSITNEVLWKAIRREKRLQQSTSPTDVGQLINAHDERSHAGSGGGTRRSSTLSPSPKDEGAPGSPFHGDASQVLASISSGGVSDTVLHQPSPHAAGGSNATPHLNSSEGTPLRVLAAMYKGDITIKSESAEALGVTIPASFNMSLASPRPPSSGVAKSLSRIGSARSMNSGRVDRSNSPPRPPPTRTASAGGGRRLQPRAGVPKGVVTQLIVQNEIPIGAHVISYLVPYERQGNRDYYSAEALRQRNALKTHFLVLSTMEKFWSLLPKTLPSKQYLNLEMYQWMHKKLYFAFANSPTEELWAQIVQEDWRVDSKPKEGTSPANSAGLLSEAQFMDYIFGVADIWCQTIDATEYDSFLNECMTVVTSEGHMYNGSLSEESSSSGNGGGGSQQGMSKGSGSAAHLKRSASSKSVVKAMMSRVSSRKDLLGQPAEAEAEKWTKEDLAATAKIRSLQSAAIALQSAKAFDELLASGMSEVDNTEVRQLQGLFRLVCEIEEREEEELRRLAKWAMDFAADYLDNVGSGSESDKAVEAGAVSDFSSDSPPPSLAATQRRDHSTHSTSSQKAIVQRTSESSVVPSTLASLHSKLREQIHLTDDLIDNEGLDRQNVNAIISKAYELLTAPDNSPLFHDEAGGLRYKRDVVAQQIVEIRQRISLHWRAGQQEKINRREQFQQLATVLKEQFDKVYNERRTTSTIAATDADDDMREVLSREMMEMLRHAEVENSRSGESCALFEFVTKQMAALKPMTRLLETSLATIREAHQGQREVHVGSAEWKQQVAIIGKLEVGLYYVTDSLHQQMQKGLGVILDRSEKMAGLLYHESKFLRVLSDDSVKQRIEAAKAAVMERLRVERDCVNTEISGARLHLNNYYTRMCSEEKKALTVAHSQASVMRALALRLPFYAEENERQQLIATNATWFTVTTEKRPAASNSMDMMIFERTHCSPQFFAFMQHLTVEWTCRMLSALLNVYSAAVLRQQEIRSAQEKVLSDILAAIEGRAVAAAVAQRNALGWSLYPSTKRLLADRQAMDGELTIAIANSIHGTVYSLISIPQDAMAQRSEYFARKAFEWKERREIAVHKAKALQKETVIRSLAHDIMSDAMQIRDTDALNEANETLERLEMLRLERERELLEYHEEEVAHMDNAKAIAKEREKNAKEISSLMAQERDARAKGELRLYYDKLHQAEVQQKRTLRQMKLQHIATEWTMVRRQDFDITASANGAVGGGIFASGGGGLAPPVPRRGLRDILAIDTKPPSTGSDASPPAEQPPVPFPNIAKGAPIINKRGAVEARVSNVRGDLQYEKRKQVYLRNKLSNADIFVGECVKLDCGIIDGARIHLSTQRSGHDARIFPFADVPFGSIAVAQLLGDLILMNPIQQLVLQHCSLTNATVLDLARCLTSHPTLMFLDLRNNPSVGDDKVCEALVMLAKSNLALLFVPLQGTACDAHVVELVDNALLSNRAAKLVLRPEELELLVCHYRLLCEVGSGYLTHESVEQAKKLSREVPLPHRKDEGIVIRAPHLPPARHSKLHGTKGDDLCATAAVQSLLAAFVVTNMKKGERWGPRDFLRRLFPSWNARHTDEVAENFTLF